MFRCNECAGDRVFANAGLYLAHIQFYHNKLIAAGNLTCTHSNCCGRTYDKMNSFRKHVKTHDELQGKGVTPRSQAQSFSQVEINDNVNTNEGNNLGKGTNPDEKETLHSVSNEGLDDLCKKSADFDNALTEAVITFIASLYDSGYFSESQIQFIIESHVSLLGGDVGFLNLLKNQVESLLKRGVEANIVSNEELNKVNRMFHSCQFMFQDLDSECKRLSEIENSGAYIKPQPFNIGEALNETIVNHEVVKEPICLTGQFIPLRDALKGFFELPGVLDETLAYIDFLENSREETHSLENLIQGELWQKRVKPKFVGKRVIPLTFYFDDYEANKELGSHTGVHKLGGGYTKVSCLPPRYQSKLENIFLTVLFHSSDKAFGNRKLFRKVISEFQFLEESGIFVSLPDKHFHIFFTPVLITGDNLGANGILGFVESFSANFFCRVCTEIKHETRTQPISNPEKRRTARTYESDLERNDPSLTGLKERCVFNDCKGFHVFENQFLDIMHDVDEGVFKYLMFSIINNLVAKGRFSIEYLNELIQGFYFGPNESRNKPPLITKEDLSSGEMLRASAAEIRCLVRYFGLMVEHVIKPADSDVWNLYLIARQFQDILTAPKILKSDIERVKNLIKDFLSEYMRIFKCNLKPKFHFLTHYPEIISDLGPLDHVSCYRFESKHKEGKEVSRNSNNRINLPFTVAKRHQLKFAFRLLSSRGFIPKFEYSTHRSVRIVDAKNYEHFKTVLPLEHQAWNSVKWLQIDGTKYEKKSVVVLSVRDTFPVFGQIELIVIPRGKEAYFIVQKLKVIKFDNRVHAYEVKITENWAFVNISDLITHVPSDIRSKRNILYVPFRFCLNGFK